MSDDRLERLEEIARERWGDEWAIDQKHWADGTTSEYAFHTVGPVDCDDSDGVVVDRERLHLDDEGRYVVSRVRLRCETVLRSETVADPFGLVDDSSIRWSWVRDSSGRWHRVIAVDESERTVACGETVPEAEVTEMASYDPDEPAETDPTMCDECLSADPD